MRRSCHQSHLFLIPAITLFAAVQVFVSSFAILALSSLSKSRRFVAMMYAGILFFAAACGCDQALRLALRGAAPGRGCRRSDTLNVIADGIFAIFRDRAPPGASRSAVIAVVVLIAALIAILEPSCSSGVVRAVEIVVTLPQPQGDPEPGRGAIIATEHLSKWYGQVSGLNDVTVALPPGITGLLGPNGAGKSTFMKLVTGQLRPSAGAVRVFGEPIWGNPALYFRIGFCPEQDAFYERMTGLEWVTALVRLNGLSIDESTAAATRALETVDLLDAADRRIGGYSKGMRQRVKLAQAIAHDPELLILDEPLSGMDPIMRRRTIRVIKEWGRVGKSVLVSSHILHEIEAMTSNILLIHNGRILAEGNVHQIRALIDEHPHTVSIRTAEPRALARQHSRRGRDYQPAVRTWRGGRAGDGATLDAFYSRLTDAGGASGGGRRDRRGHFPPDDNLQAVFKYLVKQ